MKMLRTLALVSLFICCNASFAAPKSVSLEYQVTRNGQPFATVTESYKSENNTYVIESITKGKGIYALLGKRVLTSEGEINHQGLRPLHFETLQNGKKNLISDFDWANNELTLNNKGNIEKVSLDNGSQDLLSFIYQFMFSPMKSNTITLSVTTGRNLRAYTYQVLEKETTVETSAGNFKALHLINASQDPKDDKKELWLSKEIHHLPVKIIMHDDTGATIEQVLSSVHAE